MDHRARLGQHRVLLEDRLAPLLPLRLALRLALLLRLAEAQLLGNLVADHQLLPAAVDVVGASAVRVLVS